MPGRIVVLLAITLLMGLAVLYAGPAARKRASSAAWRGHVKPPPPPPWTSRRERSPPASLIAPWSLRAACPGFRAWA